VTRLLLARGLPRWPAKRLVDLGSDMLHVADVGMAPSSDSHALDFARRERRGCVTFDADFPTQLAVSGATGLSTIRIRVEGLRGLALAEFAADQAALVPGSQAAGPMTHHAGLHGLS
jgi:predicted nuclease of predicted toxin-antitoxin system